MRTFIDNDPYIANDKGIGWIQRGVWPCKWVSCKDAGRTPFVTAYRKRFTMPDNAVVRAHVSADERYELFLDGKRIGRGPERCDQSNWRYETYDIPISGGHHTLVARVWSLGRNAPFAQMTVYPGFIFSPEGDFIQLLGTGVAEWEAKKLDGYEFVNPTPAWGSGWNLIVDGAKFAWGFERGEGDGWEPVEDEDPGANGFIRNEYPTLHLMKPAILPPMIEEDIFAGAVRFVSDKPGVLVNFEDNITSELDSWNLIEGKGNITIPANTTRRVIIDLDEYYCCYPEIAVSGGRGSEVQINWAESLYTSREGYGVKENRNELDGKDFWSVGDTFRPDGGKNRTFGPFWWQAGRYVELVAVTKDEPLTIESFRLSETRYPLEMDSKFECSDPRLAEATQIMLRALQMCSHETYMDCPYYEQLQYAGDTRLECLATYAITLDDRLPRQALTAYDGSRHISGVTESRYPCHVTQIIPAFSLWWAGMVHDYSRWRDDADFVQGLMPGVRAVMDFYLRHLNNDGLIEAPNGWNFVDWVPSWAWGMPADADLGVSGVVNWQFVYALNVARALEESTGHPIMGQHWADTGRKLASRAWERFWDDERGLLADDLAHTSFSEHTQCLALLSGALDEGDSAKYRDRIVQGLLNDENLHRTTISYSHYLFETYKLLGRIDKMIERMDLWFTLKGLGLKTAIEMPEPSRSDCHGWAAHPIYHYFATILGIRPNSTGFGSVVIEPELGPLTSAKGSMVHPRGSIDVDLKVESGVCRGSISLPSGVTGVFKHGGKTVDLKPGRQTV
ncbi:MAG: alpha-L-rhamnosidase [Armatimonadetes bacterium]|jgi:hypothetical protein|nr:alpha-L-rhamnosidase [Armatimonadota bacterium]